MLRQLARKDTIIAIATPPGMGAIAVIRLSGPEAISKTAEVFTTKNGKSLLEADPYTIHFGDLKEGDRTVDEVLISVFKNPRSYTGEDTVEISCHGSTYIQQEILDLFMRRGVRHAEAGEFTMRAFMNGKFDLSQAEAVADLIHSTSAASHELAIKQMRGGFSDEIKALREKLVNFASLIELELDFGEEDVEFADRSDLKDLVMQLQSVLQRLIDSFRLGNVLKNGIPVAIVGEPNVGKSTLLNALLNEERAIVSNIAGTTRDVIEDELIIDGVSFRFIDTAGIRETSDEIETIGIEKTQQKIEQANLVLYLFVANQAQPNEIKKVVGEIREKYTVEEKPILIVINKIDEAQATSLTELKSDLQELEAEIQYISAKNKENIDTLKSTISNLVLSGRLNQNDTIVTNTRHVGALTGAEESLQRVMNGLESDITGDFLAMDIRQSLHYLGEITGEITTDDLLGNIFSKFCIGK